MSDVNLKVFKRKASTCSSLDTTSIKVQTHTDLVQGWWVVFGAFVLLMITSGPCSVLGVLLEEYRSNVFPDTPTATISWIGTLQFGAMTFFCAITGIMLERYDSRLVVLISSLLSGSAYLIASICNSPIALLLVQGLLFGIGASSLMIAGFSLPSQWLQKHKALGVGIASSGSSIGGLWLSFATQAIISNPNLGWRWALRITGLIILGSGSAVSPLMKTRTVGKKQDRTVDFAILKNWRFILWFLFCLCECGAYYLIYAYIPVYVVEALHKAPIWSANTSSILSASSVVGRIVMGYAADHLGNLNCLCASLLITALAFFTLWLPFKSLGVLIAAVIILGFFTGAVVSLSTSGTAQLFGAEKLPTIFGFLLFSNTIGTFVCVPVAGALLDKYGDNNNFTAIILYGGAFYTAATLILLGLRLSIAGIFKKA